MLTVYGSLVRFSGFRSLLYTLFFGAFNDNLFKIVISLFAANIAVRAGSGGAYLATVGALFVLPYLLFSGYAGYLGNVGQSLDLKHDALLASSEIGMPLMQS